MRLLRLALLGTCLLLTREGEGAVKAIGRPKPVAPAAKPKPVKAKPKVEAKPAVATDTGPRDANDASGFPLAELETPKVMKVSGPDTLTIEITRDPGTTKATMVRVALDKKNKVLALKELVTAHELTIPAGTHQVTMVGAFGKKKDGTVRLRFAAKPAAVAPETTTEAAPVEAAAPPPAEAPAEVTKPGLRFALGDLIKAKTISVSGPNAVTIEIKRGAATSKATKVRFTLDGKLNKIVTLVSQVTTHKVQVPAGSHALLMVAAIGKQREGEVLVTFEQAAPVSVVSDTAPAVLAATAAGSDVVNAPLADLSADKPIAIPKGSHLSALAWQLYGNEGYWPVLYEVNRARIGDNPNRVEHGTELYLPDSAAAEAIMAWVQAGKKDPPPRKLRDALAIARVVQDATDDEPDSDFALAAAKEAARARELAQAKEEAAKREAAAAAEAAKTAAQEAKEAAAKKAEAAAREAQLAKEAATKKEKAAADAKGGDTDEQIASQVKTNLRALVESGTIDARVAKVQILSKRGTRIVVDVSNTKKKGPKREGIALMPLQHGSSLDGAWMPLMSELLYERGKDPVYPPAMPLAAAKARVRACTQVACYQEIAAALGAKRLITGRVDREGPSHFVTFSLHDLSSFTEVARVQRTWGRGAMLDRELGAVIDELLSMTPQTYALAPTETKRAAPEAGATATSREPQLVYRYRPYAITFTTIGAAGLAGGVGLLIGNVVARNSFAGSLAAYNSAPVRTRAQFDALVSEERLVNGLQIWGLVALGVGAAALTTGIVFFIIDGQPADPALAITPTGNGFSLSGRF